MQSLLNFRAIFLGELHSTSYLRASTRASVRDLCVSSRRFVGLFDEQILSQLVNVFDHQRRMCKRVLLRRKSKRRNFATLEREKIRKRNQPEMLLNYRVPWMSIGFSIGNNYLWDWTLNVKSKASIVVTISGFSCIWDSTSLDFSQFYLILNRSTVNWSFFD